MDVVLISKQEKKSISDHLKNLLIVEKSRIINYSSYFSECDPSFCTFIISDQTNFFHATTVFFSLYGGLVIILRLLIPLIISTLLHLKYRFQNKTLDSSMLLLR
jgi:hypothetical protein